MGFVEDITDFIFVENEPERADIIFIPGGDQGGIAVTAAKLYLDGLCALRASVGPLQQAGGTMPDSRL